MTYVKYNQSRCSKNPHVVTGTNQCSMQSEAIEGGVGEGGLRKVGTRSIHEHSVECGNRFGANVLRCKREEAEGLAASGGVDEQVVAIVVSAVAACDTSVVVEESVIKAS